MPSNSLSFQIERPTRALLLALLLGFFICAMQTTTLASGSEQVREFTAREILTPEQITGPYHQVGDTVYYDGLFFRFHVVTPFGRFTPGSTFALNVLIGELNAIAEMKKVETSDTAIESMKASGRNTIDCKATLRRSDLSHAMLGFSFQDQIESESYADLVAAMSRAIAQLSRVLAEELKSVL